jgi:3',5'-cyclic AMP phosphodiesterase CpdA
MRCCTTGLLNYKWVAFRFLLTGIIFFLPVPAGLFAQADTSFAFIAAGHAYGAHEGGNIGLHPALLDRLHLGYDSAVAFIVLTGDIVNISNNESWAQVAIELDSLGLTAYYAMGNHDNNAIGHQVFEAKHGGTHYAFNAGNARFIVLNSPEADRAISPEQLVFLEEQISTASDSLKNVFVFFHEVIWNSHEKYREVRSNNRSRYDQIINYSNYWEEVQPLFLEHPAKNFYVISGDVGGNPDAIAAFYDTWDNVTLLSSGMGEVPDENYLLVRLTAEDSVTFELVSLDPGYEMPDLVFHSVPPAPGAIQGPTMVVPGSQAIEYSVPEVFNADSYRWELPEEVQGSSSSPAISVNFSSGFEQGILSVQAARDGFGAGPASSLEVEADVTSTGSATGPIGTGPLRIGLGNLVNHILLTFSGTGGEPLRVVIHDPVGRVLWQQNITTPEDQVRIEIGKDNLPRGICIITASTPTRRNTLRSVIW